MTTRIIIALLVTFFAFPVNAKDSEFTKFRKFFKIGTPDLGSQKLKEADFEEDMFLGGKCVWHSRANKRFASALYVYKTYFGEPDPLAGTQEDTRIAPIGYPYSPHHENHYVKLQPAAAKTLHRWHEIAIFKMFREKPYVSYVHPYRYELTWETYVKNALGTRICSSDGKKCTCAHKGLIRALVERTGDRDLKYYVVELRCPFRRCLADPCKPNGDCPKPNPGSKTVPIGAPMAYCYYVADNKLD